MKTTNPHPHTQTSCFKPFEHYLMGKSTIRCFAKQHFPQDLINDIVPILSSIQDAHQQLVQRQAKNYVLAIVRAFKQGKIGPGKITKTALAALLDTTPTNIDTIEQLFTPPAIKRARSSTSPADTTAITTCCKLG